MVFYAGVEGMPTTVLQSLWKTMSQRWPVALVQFHAVLSLRSIDNRCAIGRAGDGTWSNVAITKTVDVA